MFQEEIINCVSLYIIYIQYSETKYISIIIGFSSNRMIFLQHFNEMVLRC